MAACFLIGCASTLWGQPSSLDVTRQEIEAVYKLYIKYFAEADAEAIAGFMRKTGRAYQAMATACAVEKR
jgi:hypothetical protein